MWVFADVFSQAELTLILVQQHVNSKYLAGWDSGVRLSSTRIDPEKTGRCAAARRAFLSTFVIPAAQRPDDLTGSILNSLGGCFANKEVKR